MRHKGLKLVITVIIILAIPISILIIDSLKTATLLIYVTPLDATITIDDKQYSNGNYRLFPQDKPVVATISKEGYQSKEVTLNLESNKTTTLYSYLFCDNSELYCYIKDTKSYDLLKYLNSNDDILNSFLSKSAILDLLPIYTSTISISLNPEKTDTKISLDVFGSSNDDENQAYEIIKQSGFNPSNYQIIYTSLAKTKEDN